MQGQRSRIIIIISLLLGGLAPAPAKDAALWLRTYQAYLQGDAVVAHTGFAQLLRDPALSPVEREEMRWQDACCLHQLNQPMDTAALLEELLQETPNSPYLTSGRPLLYRCYLQLGELTKAEALWTETLKRWNGTPYAWDMLRAHLEATAQYAPDRIVHCADLIASLPITDAGILNVSVYRPLLAARRVQEVQALHKRLQALFAAMDPALSELDQQAYGDALTRNLIKELIAECRNALNHGDLEAANIWMDHINMMIPEYPQAAEMRALYKAKVKELRKD